MSGFAIKRVDRLIGLSVLASVLTVWLVLTGFDAVTQLLRQLGSIGKHGYTLVDAIMYVLVTFPRRAYEMFGYSALIGGLLSLGGLAASGELLALRAAGMSQLRIAGSAVGVIAVLIAGVVLLGETAAPWGDQVAQSMQLRMRAGTLGLATRSGLWTRDGNNIINARGTTLRQHDGVTGAHTTAATTQPWQAQIDPQVLVQSVVKPQYLSMRDLQRNIGYLRSNGEQPGSYAVAFWGRALYPFNVLILVYGLPPLWANLLPGIVLALAATVYFRRRV